MCASHSRHAAALSRCSARCRDPRRSRRPGCGLARRVRRMGRAGVCVDGARGAWLAGTRAHVGAMGGGPRGEGAMLDPALLGDDGRIRFITKRSYSAFYGTDLEVMLRRLDRDCHHHRSLHVDRLLFHSAGSICARHPRLRGGGCHGRHECGGSRGRASQCGKALRARRRFRGCASRSRAP